MLSTPLDVYAFVILAPLTIALVGAFLIKRLA